MTDGTEEVSNSDRLDNLFEPHSKNLSTLNEALEEVAQEEADKKKGSVKELIRKAMELRSQQEAAKKEFNTQSAKWEKELGKVLTRLEGMAKSD